MSPKSVSRRAGRQVGRVAGRFRATGHPALAAVLLVAMFTVHLPYGFISIKLQGVMEPGAQFGPPGCEIHLLYFACLTTFILGGSGPFALDSILAKPRARRKEVTI